MASRDSNFKIEQLREIINTGVIAADAEVVDASHLTAAARTRLAVTVAIDHLHQIGFILIAPNYMELRDQWLPLDRQEKRI